MEQVFCLPGCYLKHIKIKIYKITILPLVLYGCETWSLTLWEEHRLRVFENRVLRRILEPVMDEVAGEWRKLHNEELCNLYSLQNITRMIKSRRTEWARHVVCMGEIRNAYKLWLESLKGRGRLEDIGVDRRTVRMDLKESGWEGVDWNYLATVRDQ
jgi:hypothetical protein